MATVNQKLAVIQQEKEEIKAALIAKGVNMTGKTFTQYSEAIVSISGAGNPKSFSGTKEFANLGAAGEMNAYDVVGALLFKKQDGTFVFCNGDPATRLWDPKGAGVNTKAAIQALYPTYGELIAVCVGIGKWAYVDWTGLTNTYTWTDEEGTTTLYNTKVLAAIHGTGVEATEAILKIATENDVLWNHLNTLRADYKTAYIPSKYELLDAQQNCCDGHTEPGHSCSYTKNIGTLLLLSSDSCYWSSSQYPGSYDCAYFVYFYNGYVKYFDKYIVYRSLAFLHFGAA